MDITWHPKAPLDVLPLIEARLNNSLSCITLLILNT